MAATPTSRDLAVALARLESIPCPTEECRAAAAASSAKLRAALDDSLAGRDVDPGLLPGIAARFERLMPVIEAASAGRRPELQRRSEAALKRIVDEKLLGGGMGESQTAPAAPGRTLLVVGLALAAGAGLCRLWSAKTD